MKVSGSVARGQRVNENIKSQEKLSLSNTYFSYG
jgi:hypothetical protein